MLAFYRLRELRMLESQRGGFHQGCRSRAAFIYAKILRSSGFSRVDVLQHVTIMGKNCSPPLPACNCLTAAKSAFSRSRHTGIKDQTIADWLDISPEECAILPGRDSGRRMPAASRYGDTGSMASGTPHCGKVVRQAAILKLVQQLGFVPTRRAMAAQLGVAGFPANHVTVAGDYIALGLETDRIKQSRSLLEVAKNQPSLFE